MKLKLILLFLILSGELFSQNKLYYSYEDFFAGKYEVCEKLNRELDKIKENTGFYIFSTGEKEKDIELKKKVKLIETKSALYLNCRPLNITNGYIKVLHIISVH